MSKLKLGKLPDRQLVKIAFKASPNSCRCFRIMRSPIARLTNRKNRSRTSVPFILIAFLQSDRGFAKARRDKLLNSAATQEDPWRDRDRSVVLVCYSAKIHHQTPN